MTSLIGRKLGPYEIRDVIGHGGMATVYLGYRADVDRTVAVKVLPPHPGMSADANARFQLEARTIANLQHPHILPLYDYGTTEDGVLYLVMPYITGGALDRILRDGRLAMDKVTRMVREIASALDYAHRQGVIHRDIKPANILIDGEGNALLADFGIVKLAEGGTGLTGTGVVGTPAYMSPEQAQGFELTPRADLYSFGIVVYEMITGKLPFSSDSVMQLMLKHLTDAPTPPSEALPSLSQAVDTVLLKVLEKEPEARYASATAFFDALQQAVSSTALPRAGDDPTVRLGPGSETPASTTPRQPIQIKMSRSSTPITLPIDPENPNQPGTIVIQSEGQGISMPLIVGFAVVALVALVALIAVLLSTRTGEDPDITNARATEQASLDQQATRAAIAARLPQSFGQVSFSSTEADMMGDSINVSVREFPPAGAGTQYIASLLDSETGERLVIGRLTVDAVGSGALSFTDGEGRSLPLVFDTVEVSMETSPAEPTFEDVRFRGRITPLLQVAMNELFVASENGLRGRSLLDTALVDANFATQHAGLAANSVNLPARWTHNEHTLNILLGGTEDFDGNGRGSNPGTGIGLLTTLDRIEAILQEAVNAEDTPFRIQNEAELVRVCLQNVREWSNQIIALEQQMLVAESFEDSEAAAVQSTEFADILTTGVDQNLNGTVEPFEGECGLEQIGIYGLIVASLDLYEVDGDTP
ncbi:MAG: serine/threonine protein kinase [Chloroflexi bacterium]|nr:serine/threonine protein kinase [Chloroflexota bacterium]